MRLPFFASYNTNHDYDFNLALSVPTILINIILCVAIISFW